MPCASCEDGLGGSEMAKLTSFALWGIETPDLSSNPPQMVNEKLSRAIRLGVLVNACDWSWRQGLLTRSQECVDAGYAALEAVLAILPQDSPNSEMSRRKLEGVHSAFQLLFA